MDNRETQGDAEHRKPISPRRRSRIVRILIGGGLVILGGWLVVKPLIVERMSERLLEAQSKPPVDVPVVGLSPDFTADQRAMYSISFGGPFAAGKVIDNVVDAKDKRFCAVLLEMLMANEIEPPIVGVGVKAHLDALLLLAESPELNESEFSMPIYRRFAEWYARTNLEPPPGYSGWKGRVLGRIDSVYREIFTDDVESTIRVEEVCASGEGFYGVPALDRPRLLDASNATYLEPTDPVYGLVVDDHSCAYPARIIEWHDIVNGTLGEAAVTVARCPWSNATIAYRGNTSDQGVHTFGPSGLVYRGNSLMWDRETRSLWPHMSGRPVIGPLATSDVELQRLPLVLTTWDRWKTLHPDTKVVDLNTGYRRDYETYGPRSSHHQNRDVDFPVAFVNRTLPPKQMVFGLRVNEQSKAYPVQTLVSQGITNGSIGGKGVVIVAPAESIEVIGREQVAPSLYEEFRYALGAELRAYERDDHEFHAGESSVSLIDDNGDAWTITEHRLIGDNGETLPRVSGIQAYWYSWHVLHPTTSVAGQDE